MTVSPRKKKAKRWPRETELMAWWIFMKLDSIDAATLTPQMILDMLLEIRSSKVSLEEAHRILHDTYKEFREAFSAAHEGVR